MKFCTDCIHHRSDRSLHWCNRAEKYVEVVDPVRGRYKEWQGRYRNAQAERDSLLPWNCGKKARFFVPIKEVP